MVNQTQDVHAPYHFVPLSKWVYMPDWAHLVSHDVPFKDGYSGVIDYTLTNSTPLCVGGKQTKTNGEPSMISWAKDPMGRPVIPGSSLKGMIRNVLEIASFGKFNAVDDKQFSYRDISAADSRYAKELQDTHPQAYWIKFDNEKGEWTFRKAKHTSIFHDELKLKNNKTINLLKHGYGSTESYQNFPLTNSIYFKQESRTFSFDNGKPSTIERARPVPHTQNNAIEGHIAFSSFRLLILPKGVKKHNLSDDDIKRCRQRTNFSYVFHSPASQAQAVDNGNKLVNNMFSASPEDLVNYLQKNQHPELGIPVFSRESKQGKILALGFCKMPRKLYELSIHEVASQSQKLASATNVFDLPELMFGTLRDAGYSLKSRIMFSDATCVKNTGLSFSSPTILGQPKASYLAAYVEQNANNQHIVHGELNQYEKKSTLKGWKRYPIQSKLNSTIPTDLKDKVNVQSCLEFMKPESQFNGKIIFHNLKELELGALLWALKFEKNQHISWHGLGHGKPLGAGAIRFNSLKLNAQSNTPKVDVGIDLLLNQFIDHMNAVHPEETSDSWQASSQLRHLFSFADQSNNNDKTLSYMPLKSERNSSVVSYAESQRGRTKNTLPNWQSREESLSRTSPITQNQPNSFAQGRLAGLINHAEKESLLNKTESLFLDTAKEAQRQLDIDNMSEGARMFTLLGEKLNHPEIKSSKSGRQSCNNDIEQLLDTCLSTDCNDFSIMDFYLLCQDKQRTAYLDLAKNNKNKDKLRNRKAKLAELAEKYDLQV